MEPPEPAVQGPELSQAAVTAKLFKRRARSISNSSFVSELSCDPGLLRRSAGDFSAWLARRGGWPADMVQLVARWPKSQTMILLSVEIMFWFQEFLLRDFLCGLQRLGLMRQTVALVVNDIAEGVVRDYDMRVLALPSFRQLAKNAAQRTGIKKSNRLAKVVGASFFVEQGFTVLVADTDTVWVSSPLPYLESFAADLVGSRDWCWLDMNSGFLLYRPTEPVKQMLRTTLGYVKKADHDTDGDQYIFNCALAHAALYGDLKVAFNDDRVFFGSRSIYVDCFKSRQKKLLISVYDSKLRLPALEVPPEEAPPVLVWHYSGITGLTKKTVSTLVLLDALNSDHDGTCLPPRSAAERQALSHRLRMHCHVQWTPRCEADCGARTRDMMTLVEFFGTRFADKMPAYEVLQPLSFKNIGEWREAWTSVSAGTLLQQLKMASGLELDEPAAGPKTLRVLEQIAGVAAKLRPFSARSILATLAPKREPPVPPRSEHARRDERDGVPALAPQRAGVAPAFKPGRMELATAVPRGEGLVYEVETAIREMSMASVMACVAAISFVAGLGIQVGLFCSGGLAFEGKNVWPFTIVGRAAVTMMAALAAFAVGYDWSQEAELDDLNGLILR